MFQVFSFAFAKMCAVNQLPVEMIAMILRYLDDDSLLNAFEVNQRWKEIIRADPILRERLRKKVLQIRKVQRQKVLNPGLIVEIERPSGGNIFRKNTVKTVKVEKIKLPEISRVDKIRKELGPIRRKTQVRSVPYKTIRI